MAFGDDSRITWYINIKYLHFSLFSHWYLPTPGELVVKELSNYLLALGKVVGDPLDNYDISLNGITIYDILLGDRLNIDWFDASFLKSETDYFVISIPLFADCDISTWKIYDCYSIKFNSFNNLFQIWLMVAVTMSSKLDLKIYKFLTNC